MMMLLMVAMNNRSIIVCIDIHRKLLWSNPNRSLAHSMGVKMRVSDPQTQ